MLANDGLEAETDELEAKTEQAKINKQLQIENNAASNKNRQSSRICRKPQWLLDSIHSAISNIKEPKTYSEAVGDPVYGKQWETAICDELGSLNMNGTWCLEDLPYGYRTITSKWVFKAKKHQDGTLEQLKA